MKDKNRTKEQLLSELVQTRQRVAELEKLAGECKQAREELRGERDKAQKYFDVAYAIMVVMDSQGKVRLINQKGCEVLGYRKEEILGKDWFDNFVPERIRGAVKAVGVKLMVGKIEPVEYFENSVVARNGEERLIAWHNAVLKDEEGNIIATLSSGEDITERKKAEEALRNSEERLKVIFEYAPDALYVNDLKGNFVDGNKAAEEITGYKRDGLIGKSFLELKLLPLNQIPKAAVLLAKNALGQPTGPDEFALNRRDGTKVQLEISTFPVEIEGKSLILGVARDITERKKAEEERKNLEQRLQLASRLATVGEMSAGIAHEINNPLTGVIGFAQLLMQKKDIPEDIREYTKIIHDGAQRVASIVDRLLTFARQRKPERGYTSINDIIQTTLKVRAYEMETSNIKLTTRLDPGLPGTMADAAQLQQVFLNIIINAETEMKSAHGKGELQVKTELEDNTIRISFKDNGPGIAPENLERVFDPFFTTRKVGKGTGLGLSLCHGIIAEHHGQIYVKSRLGQGATFVVELPVVAEEKQVELAEPAAYEARKITGAKILVVDDEPTILQFLNRILTDEGHRVETVDNAAEALEKIKSERYNLILLDIKLPGMSGMELYENIRRIAQTLARRVVFITGDVMAADTRNFLFRVKAPYISKPFDAEKMMKDINRILTEGI